MKWPFFFLLFVFFLTLPGQAAAQTPTRTPTPRGSPAPAAPDEVTKTVCAAAFGYANLDDLKADVLLQAKRQAVGELFGELISASTQVENFAVTSDQIRALSAGFVRVREDIYSHGPNLAEVCVTIAAYTTAEDRTKFEPVAVEKRNCVTDAAMSVGQIRTFAQEEVLVQAIIEYDRRLADTERESLLRLLRRVEYTESGFATGTESYCVTAQGEVTPVEVLALLAGTEVGVTATPAATSSRTTTTPTPQSASSAVQATATPRGAYTPIPAKSQSARIVVRGADSSWMAPMAESSLADAIPNQPTPRLFAAYTEALQQILFPALPVELSDAAAIADFRIRSAYTESHLSLRFVPLPAELLAVLAEIGQ
jgi:hypothetical protein